MPVKEKKNPKIAFTHNWLTNRGGSEKVLFELHRMYPDAPIYTLVYKKELFPELKNADVRTSWLQHIPWLRYHHELFPPLRYFIWRFTSIKNMEVVFTSSTSENKAVRTPGAKHIAYIHSPPHYYWRYFKDYLAHPGFGKLDPLARLVLRFLNPLLRHLDNKAAQNPDLIYGNSAFICGEIKKYYGREADVLYPSVDTERFAKKAPKAKQPYSSYFLVFGRQTVFKKHDLIVATFKHLSKNLVVVGGGPEHERLVAIAGQQKNITFLENVDDLELAALVQGANGCIFANEEDFGITWVESMAAGTPVIAYGSGGALETVVSEKTGVFFYKQTSDSLATAISHFSGLKFSKEELRQHAKQFDVKVFQSAVQNCIENS